MKRSLSGFDPILVSMYGNELNGFFDSVTGFLNKTQTVATKSGNIFSSITDIFSPKQNIPPPKAGFDMKQLIVPGAIIGGVLLIKMLKR
jgi:hypothetical protein